MSDVELLKRTYDQFGVDELNTPTVGEVIEWLSDKLDLSLTEFTVESLAWALGGG